MVRKDVMRIMRIWAQTFLPSVVTSVLYFLIFGAFIGSQIGKIQGVSYISFVVPGLVMLAVITNAYSNTVFTMFSSKFFARTIDEIIVSPTPPWVIVAGYVAGGVVRGVLIGLLVILVSLFFTHLAIHNVFIILVFLILTSIMFSVAGLINGVYAKSMDGINIVPTFVLTPLVYLGGVFYSTEVLPPFWAGLVKFDPIFYIINGFRYGFLGIADASIALSFAVLLGFGAIFIGIAIYLIRTGLGLRQ